MKGIEKIGTDFFSNINICRDPVQLNLNEECYVIDNSIIDEENETHAFIPCIVIRIDYSNKIPGRCYYMLQAKDSINDEQLNSQYENGIKFYKYLENTSPYLFKINTVIDKTKSES